MGMMRHIFVGLVVFSASASAVFSAERVALLIGNSAYKNTALSLRNPTNDVAAMSKALTEIGFTVITARDASSAHMHNALAAFEQQLTGAKLGLFFYAGHGSQVSGENFLLGSDFTTASAAGVKSTSMTLTSVRAVFARAAPDAGVVILDACRDNPLQISLNTGQRQIGLARTKGTTGLLIAYATDPGNVAFEGTGNNSIFTTALLRHLDEPGLDVRLMFGRVRQDVVLRTRGAQVPWVEESLIGEHSINNALDSEGREVAISRDIQMWRGISGKTTAEPYRSYLAAFPKGMFADFAHQRITRLSYVSAQTGTAPNQQFAALDITKDTAKIADALNILGFTTITRSTIDLDDLDAAANAYRASLGDQAALTPDNLFADASRLLLYLGGSVGRQIQVDIAALSSIDQTLVVAHNAYGEMREIAGNDPAAKPILDQAQTDIKAIERAQSEILGALDQERGYYVELMARANSNFSKYMVERTIGGAAATRSFTASDDHQTDRAKLFLRHVQQEANAQTQGTYSWLSDFLPKS